MSYNSLENYYSLIFSLIQHHKYSITEIESLFPFERDIYTDLLKNFLEELKEKQRTSAK